MNPIVIYHNKDMDGYCSGAIARLHFHRHGYPEVDMIGWDYGNPIPDIPHHANVIMTDISFPAEEMIKLQNNCALFTWIDHHKTAIKDSEDHGYSQAHGLRRVGDSASLLAWEYFFGEQYKNPPSVVYWTDRYDVWKQGDDWEVVLQMQYALRHFFRDPAEVSHYRHWAPFLTEGIGLGEYEDIGRAIYLFSKDLHKKQCQNAFDLRFHGLNFIALNHAFGGSTVLESVVNSNHDGIFMFYFDGKKYKVSLYGNGKDHDLSQIARIYNGGGHFQASGFTVSKDIMKQILDGIIQ